MLEKALRMPARIMHAGAVLSPEFILARNPIRDMIQVWVKQRGVSLPTWTHITGLFQVLTGGKYYRELLAQGGLSTGFMGMPTEAVKTKVKELITHYGFAAQQRQVVSTV